MHSSRQLKGWFENKYRNGNVMFKNMAALADEKIYVKGLTAAKQVIAS